MDNDSPVDGQDDDEMSDDKEIKEDHECTSPADKVGSEDPDYELSTESDNDGDVDYQLSISERDSADEVPKRIQYARVTRNYW